MLSNKELVIKDAFDQIRENEQTIEEIKSLNVKMQQLCEKKRNQNDLRINKDNSE